MDSTQYTPLAEDNLAGITDPAEMNVLESVGLLRAELFALELQEDTEIDVWLVLELHRIAFGELYHWAGKWRNSQVVVGNLLPPPASEIPMLMYQVMEEAHFKRGQVQNDDDVVQLLAYVHHRLAQIHPFVNGNGRISRLVMNAFAVQCGYAPIGLYHREGESRVTYIQAMRQADAHDFSLLHRLIHRELTLL